jgi:hypothetical protein
MISIKFITYTFYLLSLSAALHLFKVIKGMENLHRIESFIFRSVFSLVSTHTLLLILMFLSLLVIINNRNHESI